MYSVRPQAYRVCRPAASTRNMSVSLFPRFVQSEFAPMFRLLDDYASFANSRSGRPSTTIRSFQPRFDVKETTEGYTLTGEFPGIEQKDINIEFTDANTLSIKGRIERHRQEGTQPAAQVEAAAEQPQEASAEQPQEVTESETSSYHKASVEDESEATTSGTNPVATPATTPAQSTTAEPETQEVAQAPEARPTYWVSERSVGQFARSFTFPTRVDQENVKASLKDGILSVLVPKASLPANRRIQIE